MVLSNLSSNVDVESRAMATMGDTLGRLSVHVGTEVGVHTPAAGGVCRATRGFPIRLAPLVFLSTCGDFWENSQPLSLGLLYVSSASKGLLDAAHFCYLMAQVGLGVYTKKTTKLVLIGSNHR